MSAPTFYNVDKWIQANKNDFLPPICNKMMHDNQLKVFYVGGPNQRKDFHLEEGEELFYMVKGDMVLTVLEQGQFKDIIIREGEVFLLPSRIPHSPQRVAGTIGLVIERERKPTELDCIRWFVEGSAEILYDKWVHVKHLGTQIAEVVKEFRASKQFRTGKPEPNTKKPAYQPDSKRVLQRPFSLAQWLQDNQGEIRNKGFKSLFDTSFQTRVVMNGSGEHAGSTGLNEIFVLQLAGSRVFTILGKPYQVEKGDTLLIPPDVNYHSVGSNDCLSMFVTMDPNTKALMS